MRDLRVFFATVAPVQARFIFQDTSQWKTAFATQFCGN